MRADLFSPALHPIPAGLFLLFLFLCGCGNGGDLYLDDLITPPPLYINELLANNSAGLADPDFHETGDWIEIFNGGEDEIDMGEMFFTDDFSEPDKWELPEGTSISAGGYFLVWADGKESSGVALHARFKLNANGEEVGLYSASLEWIDGVTFGAQSTDISYGRVTDSGEQWDFFDAPTPLGSND